MRCAHIECQFSSVLFFSPCRTRRTGVLALKLGTTEQYTKDGKSFLVTLLQVRFCLVCVSVWYSVDVYVCGIQLFVCVVSSSLCV